MRILFTTSNWAGHYFCMVPTGWALQGAGHDVRVLCAPAQAAAIGQAGLVPVPVLPDFDMMYAARLLLYSDVAEGRREFPWRPLHPVTARPVADLAEFDLAAAEAAFRPAYRDAVVAAYRQAAAYARAFKPELVVHDVMSEEGAVVARELGVPSVYFSPGLFGTVDEALGLSLEFRDRINGGARAGAEPWSRDQITHMIDPSPAAALPPAGNAERLPVRYVPYNGPGDLPEWCWRHRGARRRVCILWGRSATGIHGTGVPALRSAIDAVLAQDAEVVLATSAEQIEDLGTLPVGVRVLRDFPVHLALSRCDAVIHHGSDNILMNGAVAGIPQVSLAMASDQVEFSRRMVGTGAVLALAGLTATDEEVRAAVATVLHEPGPSASALALAAQIAEQPAPAALVPALVGLAAGREVVGVG